MRREYTDDEVDAWRESLAGDPRPQDEMDREAAIDEIVGWSRTAHGGKQLPLLAEPPAGGCYRWGLCESPAKDGAQ